MSPSFIVCGLEMMTVHRESKHRIAKIPAGRQEAGKPPPALRRSSLKAGTEPVSLHSEINNSQQAQQLGSMGNWTFTSVSELVSIQDHPPEVHEEACICHRENKNKNNQKVLK